MTETWYGKLLNSAIDVAGGEAMTASGGSPALGALVKSIMGKAGRRKYTGWAQVAIS